MKKWKRLCIIGATVGALGIMAACGGGADDAGETPDTPLATPAPSPELPPEPEVEDETNATDTWAIEGLPISTATFIPGIYTAYAPGWQDTPLHVEVSFSENQITNIAVTEHGESMYGSGWFFRAYPATMDQILVRQSTQEIDEFTGATVTRNAIIAAVEDAIAQAGAAPTDLAPQHIDAPLAGDRFIPGFHIVTVPANTMDIHGNPLPSDYPTMLYSPDEDMTLRVSFGRNEFHLHTGGAFGLGQGAAGHGESLEPDTIGGGTWGSWWFRQVAHHQINDHQSTHVDTLTGATQSASAIVWGVEQAMILAGADPASITPRPVPPTQIQPNPESPDARFFIPGYYYVTVPGFGGDMELRVTLDRGTIRRIQVLEHNETEAQWDQVWPELRDLIYTEQTTHIDILDAFSGATVSAEAVIEGVREALRLAGETNEDNW